MILTERNLRTGAEYVVDTHIILVEQIEIDFRLFDERVKHLLLAILHSLILNPEWLLLGSV